MQQTVTLEDQAEVKLHIWDTGGSERFRTMVSLYYRDSQAAIICFDVTEEQSFHSTQYWVDEMRKNNTCEGFVLVLAGNKCDMHGRRVSR
jgi:Ras-related protein Rab-5C